METLVREERTQDLTDEGIHECSEFIDRGHLEAEAWELLKQQELIPAAPVKQQERQDNARTALMEALTASGHLSRVEISGSFEEINHQILSRLLNGWDDSLLCHEKARRFAELTNELFVQRIYKLVLDGELPADTMVTEVSDYPETLDDDTAKSLGYGYRNQKGMVRSHYLIANNDGTYSRIFEQVSRSRGLAPSTFSFLDAAGVNVGEDKPADILALEKPLVCSQTDYKDGVVDIVKLLDRYSGTGIIYGEEGFKALEKIPYKQLREESARRESEIECYIDSLATLEEQLDSWVKAGQISRHEQFSMFKGEVKRILNVVCTMRPEYAEDTFGRTAAPHFYEASNMAAGGNVQGARALLSATEHLQETVTFCGMSISVNQAQQMGIKVNSFAQLLEKSKKKWEWKPGYCRDPFGDCKDRNKKVDIGPCSVCRKCQVRFDEGEKPPKPPGLIETIFLEIQRISQARKIKQHAQEKVKSHNFDLGT